MRTKTSYLFHFYIQLYSSSWHLQHPQMKPCTIPSHIYISQLFSCLLSSTDIFLMSSVWPFCSVPFLCNYLPMTSSIRFALPPLIPASIFCFFHITSTSTYGCSRFSQNVAKVVSEYTALHPQSSLHIHCRQNIKPRVTFSKVITSLFEKL